MPSGSCLCGKLTYSFTQPPPMKATCHCLTCRKKSGSTYLTTIMVPDHDFTSSDPSTYSTYTGEHEVGMPLTIAFCPTCGIHTWKTAAGWPGVKIVFAGTLDGEKDLENAKPDIELWTKYRVGWVGKTAENGLEGFPGEWDREKQGWKEVAN